MILATERDGESEKEVGRHFIEYLERHDDTDFIKPTGEVIKVIASDNCIKSVNEITGKAYRELLQVAAKNDFIDDYDKTLARYGMTIITGRYHHAFSFEEFLLDGEKLRLEDALRRVEELGTVPTLKEEVGRIYEKKRKQWSSGNPVHYVLASDDDEDRNDYLLLLLKGLYSCHRINGRRFTKIDYEEICSNYDSERLNEIYRLQTGGAMVVTIDNKQKDDWYDADLSRGKTSRVAEVCRMAMKWKNRVLTVFLFPRDSERLQDSFFSEMDGISLIKIEETVLFYNDAKTFLHRLAKENKVKLCSGLYEKLEKGAGYSKRDLRKLFDNWYEGHLKEEIFPQYAGHAISMVIAKQGPKGSGIKKLEELIGLVETKELVANILDFAKAQKLYSFNRTRKEQSLHMVFSGNPGTAKTTVARLMAQILKENEVLENGDLVEVGRMDLVGKYVGHTAPQVREAFKRARGSVLFIDEAYSLVDDRDGLFGDEAITTIVQEMENMRDKVVVIFAGYPDKMEQFLSKNPGLRSRIGFHVNFPDYSPEELYEILEKLASDEKLVFAEGVCESVFPMIERAARVKEFGNGRYARNLLEKARMRQATRLVRMDQAIVTEHVAETMIAEDFEEIHLSAKSNTVQKIGFV